MAFPPSATHQYEATVINAPLEKLWELLKSFKFEVLNSRRVAATSFVDGGVGTVGSHIEVRYTEGPVWVYHLLEVSDIYHKLVFELVSAEPELTYHGALHTIKLYRDSVAGKTFLIWETDYANDAGLDVIQDAKYKKQDAFASYNLFFSQA